MLATKRPGTPRAVVYIAALLLLPLFGYLFQTAATVVDNMRYPAPGRRLEIDGHRYHLVTFGDDHRGTVGGHQELAGNHTMLASEPTLVGAPTILIDASWPGTSLDWQPVATELGEFARVVTYDRPGYGWSDPGLLPRSSEQIADELHELLIAAGIEGPYVLVGHGIGGLNMRLFAQKYANEVAGLVLVDSPHEEMAEWLPGIDGDLEGALRRLETDRILATLGLNRLLGRPAVPERVPNAAQAVARSRGARVHTHHARYHELAALPQSIEQIAFLRDLRDVPLAILTPETDAPETWRERQAELVDLSTQGWHIWVPDSGHYMHLDRPDAIIGVIRQMIAEHLDN